MSVLLPAIDLVLRLYMMSVLKYVLMQERKWEDCRGGPKVLKSMAVV